MRNGTVGCRWALRKRGAERRERGRGGLLDVGECWKTCRPAALPSPKMFRNVGRISKQFQNTLPKNQLPTTQEKITIYNGISHTLRLLYTGLL